MLFKHTQWTAFCMIGVIKLEKGENSPWVCNVSAPIVNNTLNTFLLVYLPKGVASQTPLEDRQCLPPEQKAGQKCVSDFS